MFAQRAMNSQLPATAIGKHGHNFDLALIKSLKLPPPPLGIHASTDFDPAMLVLHDVQVVDIYTAAIGLW